MKAHPLSTGLAAAGLFAGALAWATHEQASYVIAAFACGRSGASIWLVGGLAAAILVAGGLSSWLAMRGRLAPAESGEGGRPLHFLATVGLMAAGLFAFAMALQACAVLFLAPCKP